MIKWLERNAAKRQLGCAVKHSVVETEDFEARQTGEFSKSVVDVAEVLLDAALVLVQHDPRRRGIRAAHVTGRLSPREESSYGICFLAWLAFRENSLTRLSETDVGGGAG